MKSAPYILILALSALLAFAPGCDKKSDEAAVVKLPVSTVVLAGQTFTVELAYRVHTRERGLMYRTELPPDHGMLFLFRRPDLRSFYMKNCRIDLDLLYLNPDGTIAEMFAMTYPRPGQEIPYYPGTVPAQYALELPAGTIQRLNLKPGDPVTLAPDILAILPERD